MAAAYRALPRLSALGRGEAAGGYEYDIAKQLGHPVAALVSAPLPFDHCRNRGLSEDSR
jgi:hypothetical protein